MAPLDGAVALTEMDDIAVAVREDLHFHVARVVEVALDVDGGVREVRLALSLRNLEGSVDVLRMNARHEGPCRRRRRTP